MFEPNQLWKRILKTTQGAILSGALESIPTEYETVNHHEVDFLVRRVSNLERKEKLTRVESGTPDFNPFLPYEEELYVCEASDSHICLLNKFNVVDHHLLIVTKKFEHQDDPLTLADFKALMGCLGGYHSLGFYNGGKIAGASQTHKHLQLIPLPLAPEGLSIPMESLFEMNAPFGRIIKNKKIPFAHRWVRLKENPVDSAEICLTLYGEMRRQVGLDSREAPFNLLVTPEWMFLVPRSKEFYGATSINSIGFAGGLLVKDQDQLDLIKASGPMEALIHTGFPK